MNDPAALTHYPGLLAEIRQRIQTAQTRAMLGVNAELIRLYWEIGQMLDARQHSEGWGAAVIPRLARAPQRAAGGEGVFRAQHQADGAVLSRVPGDFCACCNWATGGCPIA